MYRVLHHFHDLTDSVQTKSGIIYHSYEAGDIYPRHGLDVSPERVAMLSSADNAQGIPLIELIAETEKPDSASTENPEHDEAPEMKPEQPRRSRRAKKETT